MGAAWLPLSGCSSAGNSGSTTTPTTATDASSGTFNTNVSTNVKAALTPVTIAQFGHVFLYMPLYIAQRKGFFKNEGLDVKLVSTGGDEKTFAAVSSGSAQFGVSDPTFAAIARERGQGGKVVAGVVRGVPFWVITFNEKIKPINKPEELAGYRIGTYTAPSTSYAVMAEILQNNGKPIKGKIVQGAFGSLLAILKANQADMALEIEPVVSVAIKDGARIVYSPMEKWGDFAFTGLTVSDDYFAKHPETIQKVVNALAKSMNYIHKDFDGAYAIACEEFSEVDQGVVKAALKRLVDQKTVPVSPDLSKDAWDKAIALRKKLGDLKSSGSYEDNVDMKFVHHQAH
jgi:NitT/TauT family transport system substrate-binding protein